MSDTERPAHPDFDCEPRDEPMDDWCARFFEGLRPGLRLLRKVDGSFHYCPGAEPPHQLDDLRDFRGVIPSLYRTIEMRHLGGKHQPALPCPKKISADNAAHIFYSPEAIRLPRLESVITDPMVVISGGKRIVTPEGYDPETGIYYFRKPGAPRFSPSDSTEHLTRAFSGVPFADPLYRNNLIAWLVSGVIHDREIEPPLLVISGNQPGIGKTKTMEACGVILTGKTQAPVDSEGHELEKQIGARFLAGSRFIALDNVVARDGRSFKSSPLARIITCGFSKSIRILGQSSSTEQKGVLFVVTANDCKLSDDLASRSLLVKLAKNGPSDMRPYVLSEAFEHRVALYNELLGLAVRCPLKLLSIDGYLQHFRFRSWLTMAKTLIEPLFGPLMVPRAIELDDAIQDFFAWAVEQIPENAAESPSFTSSQFWALMTGTVNPRSSQGLFIDLKSRFESIPPGRVRNSKMTLFIRSLVDEPHSVAGNLIVVREVFPGSHDRAAEFKLERLPA